MQITFNLNEKMLKRVAEEMDVDFNTLVDDVESYFKSYEYNGELLAELISDVICNY
jgi:hypothetical protein